MPETVGNHCTSVLAPRENTLVHRQYGHIIKVERTCLEHSQHLKPTQWRAVDRQTCMIEHALEHAQERAVGHFYGMLESGCSEQFYLLAEILQDFRFKTVATACTILKGFGNPIEKVQQIAANLLEICERMYRPEDGTECRMFPHERLGVDIEQFVILYIGKYIVGSIRVDKSYMRMVKHPCDILKIKMENSTDTSCAHLHAHYGLKKRGKGGGGIR